MIYQILIQLLFIMFIFVVYSTSTILCVLTEINVFILTIYPSTLAIKLVILYKILI